MTCVVVGCESQDGLPVLKVPARIKPGGGRWLPLCRRHEHSIELGCSWSLSPSADEVILNDDPTVGAARRGTPLFMLEDAGSQRWSGDRLPGSDEPSLRLQVGGFWPGHDLPETFEVVVTREVAHLLREMLPHPDGPPF